MAGCGGAGSPVVVRIGQRSITRASLDRWTAIEAAVTYEAYPRRAIPKGIIPDPPSYENCIAYSKKHASLPVASAMQSTPVELGRQCQEKHHVLQNQILEILITSYWLTSEAASIGVSVSYAEAKRVLDEKFVTQAALHRFLTLTGEREADEEFLLKRTMLANKLLAALEKPAGSRSGRTQAVAAFYTALTKKWTARTDCRPGYVVVQCRQHHAA
jgi:hypothetical protein